MATDDKYPKPSLTVDIVVLCWDGSEISLPLIRRGNEPFKGSWAIPGGFMEIDETLEQAARRELREETGLESETLVRGPIFDAVDRDPRGRVISVPHLTLVRRSDVHPEHGDDAADVGLFEAVDLPEPLAFDHLRILGQMFALAVEELCGGNIGAEFSADERARITNKLLEVQSG